MLTAVHVGLTVLNGVLLVLMIFGYRRNESLLCETELAIRADRTRRSRAGESSSNTQLGIHSTAMPSQIDAIAIVEVLPLTDCGRRQRVRLDSAGLIRELRDVESAMRREGMLPPARFVAGLNDEGRLFLQEEALVSGLRREPLDEG